MEATKKQYRVETTTYTKNPKYIRGSFAASTRHHEIISTTFTFCDTLAEAQAKAETAGNHRIQKLSPSGKSYQPVK